MPTRWTAKTWTLVAAVLGSSVVFLDSSVLTVALQAIGREPRLYVDVLEGQNYIYYGYLLTLSTFLVLAGALSDYYGRRRVFVIGLVGFALTSLLCAIAPNIEVLIIARLIQGAAGAVLVPGSLAILTTTFDGPEQGRAFGIWAAATAVAPIFGPFVGGVLVDNLSWRWVFLINLPLIAIAAWAALRYVKESRDEQASGRFDWLGALFVAVAVGGLSFGAIYGAAAPVAGPHCVRCAGCGRPDDRGDAVLLQLDRQPARAPVAVQVAQLQRHQPVDAAHLRRALRAADLPGAVHAGHAGLQRVPRPA